MVHPYISAYLQSKGKHKKILQLYNQIQRNQLQNGGGVIIDNFDIHEDINENIINNRVSTDISIFIGKVSHCLVGLINSDNPNTVVIIYFGYDKICNITKNMERNDGTSKMMMAFFKYIDLHHKNINTFILSDDSNFDCSNIKISLYMLYMLKYNTSYYEKRFDFITDKDNNSDELIKIHNDNKIKSQNIIIDKRFIINKLDHFDKSILDEFISNIKDGEYVSVFLKRFKSPDHLCHIFSTFLNIIYIHNKLNISSITDRISFIKHLHKADNRNKKLTRKNNI